MKMLTGERLSGLDTLEIYDNAKRDLGSRLVLFYHENASAGEWHSYGHLPHLQDIEVQRTLRTFLVCSRHRVVKTND